jgi:hypothetical protein
MSSGILLFIIENQSGGIKDKTIEVGYPNGNCGLSS